MDSLSRKRRLSGSISSIPRSSPSGQPSFSPAFYQTSIPGGPAHIYSQSIQNGGSGSIAIGRDNIAVTGDLHIRSNGPGGDAACLRDLRATDPRHDKTRIEQTKGGLLPASYRWILDNAEFRQWRDDPEIRLLRIMGDPGKGKSMLLCGIIDELTPVTGKNLSFFFCQGTDARLNSATAVLRGLIYMLVDQQPSLIDHLWKKYEHAGRALFEDANAWFALSEILADILRDPSLPPVFIVIDALDECAKDLPSLLSFISRTADKSQAKWLVSSRNIIDIERGLRLNPSGARLSLELKQNANQVAHAVDAYINHCVSQLLTTQDVSIRDQIKDKLREKADGTFLWVSLVIQELRDTLSWNMLEVIDETPSDLTSVYRRMMDHLQRQQRNSGLCLEILALVTTAYRPLHLRELAILSKLPERCSTDEYSKVVAMCGSFLTVREEHVYIVHQSAKDFLSADASLALFPSGVGRAHYAIVSSSLQCLSTTLRRDIYDLGQPGIAIEDFSKPSPDPLFAVRYACTYWIRHLLELNAGSQDCNMTNLVASFLRIHFLHWLESLSLVKQLPSAVVSLSRLASELVGENSLYSFLQDAHRFATYHRWIIENYPLQVYTSALVFSPTRSRVRMDFRHEEPSWIRMKPAMEDQWNACLQTLEGHTDEVNSVVFSYDSSQLASASRDKTVKVWDATTGQCLQTLDIGQMVSYIEFSEQGDCLHTNLGIFAILPTASQQVSSLLPTPFPYPSSNGQRLGYGLSIDHTWILFGDEKRLWLPPEYRPTVSAVGKRKVAIGCASGRVLQWAFE